jgi:hypothetical protein
MTQSQIEGYIKMRKVIYAKTNGTKGAMINFQKFTALKKDEKEAITKVIEALEELRVIVSNNNKPKEK